MPGRTLAIGDIHGCDVALERLLEGVAVSADDTVVLVGDVVDRGPYTRQAIDKLLELRESCRLIFVMGNHEEMLLEAIGDPFVRENWLAAGGDEALRSYDGELERVPEEHIDFLKSAIDYWEGPGEIYIHANLEPGVPLPAQSPEWLRWTKLTGFEPPHPSGKRVLCGHTPQSNGLPSVRNGWIGLDTWAYKGLYLSCLDVGSDTLYQSRQSGEFRTLKLSDLPGG